MKSTFAVLGLVASALAKPMPQGVTSAIAPDASAPASCSGSRSEPFRITVVNVTSSAKRDVERRQQAGILTLTLAGGKLKDQAGRTGYIASNYQFQFDEPPQTGAIYTSGWSLCGNNSLALGGSAIFYQCWSGSFYNLYDRHWAGQCSPIYLVAMGGGGGTPHATQVSDGRPQNPTPISEASDGQIIRPTEAPPVTQISDSQPQGPPVTQISDGQPQGPSGPAPPVTQISDGQPQAPSHTPAPPITQISDGQPQVPSAPPVTQISDGQPQAPSGPPVTQISDGQPQGPPVTQISDSQPQAPSAPPAPPVTQISDGQPQAPAPTGNATFTTSEPPAQFTGAAVTPIYGLGAVAAGIMGIFAIL
ncbi:hypothetical protein K469DRAFT_604189 [Zopfia rhizophila CBS 207.26]|uniref:Cell wall mannoprotein PIR1-like C-terminal domain-containing protein n=1 Tax=Zopfia rhizophila CBS 207.26 TaxID=1314779 RepID=A0A6A6DCJ1_9PEZI|nr:hypothetical protein K469DRAFT_604189 [Zopfia rhizophila CBS 207.26]